MTPVPFDLPLRPNEAAAIADLLFQQLKGKPLTEDQRGRIAGRLGALATPTIRAYAASLTADPIHASTYYLAVDGDQHGVVTPLLLRIAPATAPATAVFPKSLMIGRVRPPGQAEVMISAIPFGVAEEGTTRAFVESIDKAFLPRALGVQAVTIARTGDAAWAFERFRALPARAPVAVEGASFWAVVWAAIRAGRRDGYSVSAWIEGRGGEVAALRQVEESPLATRYVIAGGDVTVVGAVMDHVRRVKAGLPAQYARTVDFEVAFAAGEEVVPGLAALKAAGRTVQAVSAGTVEDGEALSAAIQPWNVALVLEGAAPAGVRAGVRWLG
jgi:hypothetical protein